jgi:hypothetical protein
MIPFWKDNQRGVPNCFLRSALFGVVKKGKRARIKNKKIASLGGVEIVYNDGEQLDQNDLIAWEQCLHYMREKEFDDTISFSAYDFLKSVGKPTNPAQYQWLESSISRLRKADIKIEDKKFEYQGTLIFDKTKDKDTNRYILTVNKKFAKLYERTSYTKLDISKRRKLKGQISFWLFNYYSSHKEPFKHKVSSIKEWCGSQTKDIKRFRNSLKSALKNLSGVTGWTCWIDENDFVHVIKNRKMLSS